MLALVGTLHPLPGAADYIRDVPYYHQYFNSINPSGSCQNTTIAITLGLYGGQLHPDQLSARYGTDKAQTIKGWEEIFNTEARRHGLGVRDSAIADGTMADIDRLLAAGLPVPVHGAFTSSGHLVVILGCDDEDYYVHDPAGDWSRGYSIDTPTAGRYARYPRAAVQLAVGDPISGFVRLHVIRPAPPPMGLAWDRALPDTLIAGEAVHLDARLAVESGVTVRAEVDLSELGGPDAVPLRSTDQGQVLQADLALAAVRHGFQTVTVTVQGDTTVQLRHPVMVLPGADEVVYDDTLGSGWREGFVRNVTPDYDDDTRVFSGDRAMALASRGGVVEWAPREPLVMHGYESLRFVIHPGEVVPGRVPALSLMVNGDSRTLIKLLEAGPQGDGIDLARATWQSVEIPMSEFSWLEEPLEAIRLFGNLQGTFWLDDVRLVADRPFPYAFGWEATTPEVVLEGQPLDLRLAVRLALDGSLPPPRVTADLRELGGPASVPLAATGAGTYLLARRIEPGPTDNGRVRIQVHVEQETGTRLHRARLEHALTVLPAADAVLYGDRLASSWTTATARNVEVVDGADTVFSGAAALALSARSLLLEWETEDPIEPVGYRALRLAFHPGAAQTGRIGAFSVMLNGDPRTVVPLIDGPLGGAGIDMGRRDWQVIEIPLEAFAPLDAPVRQVRFLGDLTGTFYLDDVRLVAADLPTETAVLEHGPAAVPRSVALRPAFPNPFNSTTTLRFTMPAAGWVELAVFDALGQRVATLVDGELPAGPHRYRWDGADDAGQRLATGLYLTRLRLRNQLAAGKLLLLR